MSKTKILMSGCNSKMGQVITKLCVNNNDIEIVAGTSRQPDKYNNPYPVYKNISEITEKVDVVIDFSNLILLPNVLRYCVNNRTALVLATTGLSDTDNDLVRQASEVIPIFKSANMSLGINVIIDLALKAVSSLGESFDIEIIEKHHNEKKDAPSGTALMIANEINRHKHNLMSFVYDRTKTNKSRSKNEIGISAIRGGTIPGEHTIIFAGKDEVIELKHAALSRDIFGVGALKASKYIITKDYGLYDMKSMIKELI